MSKHILLRQVSRASTTFLRPPTAAATRLSARSFHNSLPFQKEKEKEYSEEHLDQYTTAGKLGSLKHEGQHSRTDKRIKIEYPDEGEFPSQKIVQGRGGFHFKRTLSSFSLEGRVGVVTGGARGLGLVMSQALVVSGANVAIVDLNRMCNPWAWLMKS